MAMTTFQITPITDIDLKNLEALRRERTGGPLLKGDKTVEPAHVLHFLLPDDLPHLGGMGQDDSGNHGRPDMDGFHHFLLGNAQ